MRQECQGVGLTASLGHLLERNRESLDFQSQKLLGAGETPNQPQLNINQDVTKDHSLMCKWYLRTPRNHSSNTWYCDWREVHVYLRIHNHKQPCRNPVARNKSRSAKLQVERWVLWFWCQQHLKQPGDRKNRSFREEPTFASSPRKFPQDTVLRDMNPDSKAREIYGEKRHHE